ncbi:hypothetical protein [Micromonospora sp. CPCC 205556]|uniref:hypothetical protein n=1 Tax=Micromonospora sp. CPCC 205556 TaxID=3122398 RepID=UPI002FF2963A
MGQEAAHAGGRIAHEGVEQGRHVASEARQQAYNLVGKTSAQARSQAQQQQKRAADSLRALGTELRSMAEGDGQRGPGALVVRRGADAVDQAASWLDARQPGDLVREAREYASRHPAAFLAGATIAGLLAGRLTRALTGGQGGGTEQQSREAPPSPEDVAGVRPLHAPPSPTAGAPVRHGPSGTEVGP